jgi:hypothetical protein
MARHRQAHRGRPARTVAIWVAMIAAAVAVGAIAGIAIGSPPGRTPSTSVAASARSSAAGASPRVHATAPANPTAVALAPSSTDPAASAAPDLSSSAGRFGLGLLIADRGNGRLLIVNDAGATLWSFPAAHSLPAGQHFSADDAFISPDHRTIVANDESHQVIDVIDIATRRVIWQYGHYGVMGSALGYLHTPDDAYPLPNGNISVADIRNCRILEIDPAKRIVRRLGRAGRCTHHPPVSFNHPNGDTPLPDGGVLVTEIGGSRVVRLGPAGNVVFDIHAPVLYPSDAQLNARGNVLVVDYARPGAVVELDPRGHVVWRYGPRSGPGMLDHPSLAIPLPDGTIALNDDYHHRVVVIDPRTNRIVWQYGHTGLAGRAKGYLFVPDGIDLVPLGTAL